MYQRLLLGLAVVAVLLSTVSLAIGSVATFDSVEEFYSGFPTFYGTGRVEFKPDENAIESVSQGFTVTPGPGVDFRTHAAGTGLTGFRSGPFQSAAKSNLNFDFSRPTSRFGYMVNASYPEGTIPEFEVTFSRFGSEVGRTTYTPSRTELDFIGFELPDLFDRIELREMSQVEATVGYFNFNTPNRVLDDSFFFRPDTVSSGKQVGWKGGISFPPGYSIDGYAKVSGYDHFNVYQVITQDPSPPLGVETPYADPVHGDDRIAFEQAVLAAGEQLFGEKGEYFNTFGGVPDDAPFYYDETVIDNGEYYYKNQIFAEDGFQDVAGNIFRYVDRPTITSPTVPMRFETTLVGVRTDGTFVPHEHSRWSVIGTPIVPRVLDTQSAKRNAFGEGNALLLEYEADVDISSIDPVLREMMIRDGMQFAPTSVPEPNSGIALIVGAVLATTQCRRFRVLSAAI